MPGGSERRCGFQPRLAVTRLGLVFSRYRKFGQLCNKPRFAPVAWHSHPRVKSSCSDILSCMRPSESFEAGRRAVAQMKRVRHLLAVAVWAGIASAQNAQISGLIQDPSTSRVAGAQVDLRNEQTGGRRMTRSNDSGVYSFFSLSPGVYRIS